MFKYKLVSHPSVFCDACNVNNIDCIGDAGGYFANNVFPLLLKNAKRGMLGDGDKSIISTSTYICCNPWCMVEGALYHY